MSHSLKNNKNKKIFNGVNYNEKKKKIMTNNINRKYHKDI